jgi:hypothetical protein
LIVARQPAMKREKLGITDLDLSRLPATCEREK